MRADAKLLGCRMRQLASASRPARASWRTGCHFAQSSKIAAGQRGRWKFHSRQVAARPPRPCLLVDAEIKRAECDSWQNCLAIVDHLGPGESHWALALNRKDRDADYGAHRGATRVVMHVSVSSYRSPIQRYSARSSSLSRRTRGNRRFDRDGDESVIRS
jgi:hypothetical protein